MDSYRVGNAGAVKRIGTPHEHDVLSGRGGAINSHIGNTRFREWVRERKNRYNLARTKAEKASVANEVMDFVKQQNPPGRFLQRDQSSVTGGVTWWTEVDEIKAMAKTSQALREGAPSIRAAHKDDLTVRKRTRKPNKKSPPIAHTTTPTSTSTGKRSHHMIQQQVPSVAFVPTLVASVAVPAQAPAPAPVLAPIAAPVILQSQAMEQLKANAAAAVAVRTTENNIIPSSILPSYITSVPTVAPLPPLTTTTAPTSFYIQPPMKRSRLSENLYLPMQPQPHIVRPDDETPPLAPLPSPMPLSSIPDMNECFPMPAIPKRETSLRRSNSLALSDVGSGNDSWGDIDFVNPFDGDTSDEISAMPPVFDYMGVRSRNSMSNMSVKSELSDLCELTPAGTTDSEFGEQMKDVYDAVHPGLASPEENEPIPTHLYPYRGSYDLTQVSGGSPQLIC